MTFASQLALALWEPAQSALPLWCFPEQIEFPQQLPHQFAIRSNRERDELEIRSNRAETFDQLFACPFFLLRLRRIARFAFGPG